MFFFFISTMTFLILFHKDHGKLSNICFFLIVYSLAGDFCWRRDGEGNRDYSLFFKCCRCFSMLLIYYMCVFQFVSIYSHITLYIPIFFYNIYTKYILYVYSIIYIYWLVVDWFKLIQSNFNSFVQMLLLYGKQFVDPFSTLYGQSYFYKLNFNFLEMAHTFLLLCCIKNISAIDLHYR